MTILTYLGPYIEARILISMVVVKIFSYDITVTFKLINY